MSRKTAAASASPISTRPISTRPPTSDLRAAFLDRLGNRLRARSFGLVTGEFGRERANAVWMLTVQLPNQHVLTLRAPVESGADPFAPEVCDGIAKRVIAFLAK